VASDNQSNSDSPFQRFEKVMRALIQVPKKEVEQMAAKRRQRRERKKADKSA